MTVALLKEFGADTEEGLARCMNNEEFYLKMVNMALADERFETMKDVLEKNDEEEAFEMAHGMKGVFGNLALTPIYQPLCDLTEALRHRTGEDYMSLYSKMRSEKDRLLSMDR